MNKRYMSLVVLLSVVGGAYGADKPGPWAPPFVWRGLQMPARERIVATWGLPDCTDETLTAKIDSFAARCKANSDAMGGDYQESKMPEYVEKFLQATAARNRPQIRISTELN